MGEEKTHTHTCQLGARDEIRESNKKGQRFKMEEKPDNDNTSCSYVVFTVHSGLTNRISKLFLERTR